MAFGDKLKELAKQAQDAVAERKEKITGAVDRAGVAADARTGGKYSDKIAKVSQKAEQVVEKLSGDQGAGGAEPAGAGGGETPGGASAAGAGEASAAPRPAMPPSPPSPESPTKPAPDATGSPDFE